MFEMYVVRPMPTTRQLLDSAKKIARDQARSTGGSGRMVKRVSGEHNVYYTKLSLVDSIN